MKFSNRSKATLFLIILLIPFVIQLENIKADSIPPLDVHLSWMNDPTTTMTMTWRTTESTSSIVQYGLDSSYGNEESGANSIYHSVEVTGLTPETTYHYRVGDGTTWSGDYTFKTGTTGDHIQFIGVGDCQNRPADGSLVRAAISRLPMDMLTFTGDLTSIVLSFSLILPSM